MMRLPSTAPVVSSRSSWAVTVVPMLAPMITPTACFRFMMPAFTKPTTMTVVAEELWMMPVTRAPTPTALKMLPVTVSSVFSSFSPAIFSKALPIVSMP